MAEVLITLGIIGIVAALTIPALVQDYKEKVTVTKLQKVYAVFNNVFKLASAEHGDFQTWSWNHVETDNGARTKYFWETYGFPYLRIGKNCGTIPDGCFATDVKYPNNSKVSLTRGGSHLYFTLSDGTSVRSWVPSNLYTPHVWIYVDINGLSGPNVIGKDIFALYFQPKPIERYTYKLDEDGNKTEEKTIKNQVYGFYGEGYSLSVDDFLDPGFRAVAETGDLAKPACSTEEGDGTFCGAAIKLNGWRIPDGYPKL